jgi:hypothetical protein
MDDEDQLADELAREIVAYLDAHPDAADSLEGVVQWWLVQERFLRGIGAVGKALEQLVGTGEIERIAGPDRRPIYRAGPRRRPLS